MAKKCFKCGESKPLSGFYRHPRMADGHLGKCKECTKKDTATRCANLETSDPLWVIAERKRHREKSRRAREARGGSSVQAGKYTDPFKKKANTALLHAIKAGRIKRKPCEVCGEPKTQGHHEDYSKPLEVAWLCVRHHWDRHIYLKDCETLGKRPFKIPTWIKKELTTKL